MSQEDHEIHLKLAGVVKGVHAKLRVEYRQCEGDFNSIWDAHVQKKAVLTQYADAMMHLAIDHWDKKPQTRIDWCRNICQEYFLGDGLKTTLEKEERRNLFQAGCNQSSVPSDMEIEIVRSEVQSSNEQEDVMQTDVEEPSETVGLDSSNTATTFNTNVANVSKTLLNRNETVAESEHSCLALPEASICSTWGGSTCTSIDWSNMGGPPEGVVDQGEQKMDPLQQLEVDNDPTKNLESHLLVESDESVPALDDKIQSIRESSSYGSKEREELVKYFINDCSAFDCESHVDNIPTADEGNMYEDKDKENEVGQNGHCMLKYNTVTLPLEGKIRLLDVGSCFNPFLEFKEFLAIGIDISPAKESVFHCDFLHLETSDPLQLASDSYQSYMKGLHSPIERLPCASFHVVVFSLLLEYFPSPYQRWICCQKAHKLLMANGLLVIITPDSKSQHRNAPQMKSWKMAIESMGFSRYRYVKEEHLHCMAFRKIIMDVKEDHLMDDISPDMLYIPQDFNDVPSDREAGDSFYGNEFAADELVNTFNNDLPGDVL